MADQDDSDWSARSVVDGVISKIVVGYLWPLLTMTLIGIGGWYLKDSNEITRSHTHQLEVVMGNQDRLADRVTAEINALSLNFKMRDQMISDSLARTVRSIDDHEMRIRRVEGSVRSAP